MRHDAIVVGGSFAGLSAATYIARARRRVAVIDAGSPRNRFAAHSHGFLSRDGAPPDTVLATAREQLGAYDEVSMIAGAAIDARAIAEGFAVTLADGSVLEARKLVLAHGVTDVLPNVPGLAERWGRTVLHCPYCHGYEFSGRALGVLATAPHSAHQAMLISEWGPTVFLLDGKDLPDRETIAELERRGVPIDRRPVARLEGDPEAPVEVAFASGERASVDALFIAAPWRLNGDLAERLGCEIETGAMGPVIRTDDLKMTSVPGVYAAGDVARAPHTVTWAASDGVTAGLSVHRALAFG